MEGRNCWDRYICIWNVVLEWFVMGEIETRNLSFLEKESKCISQGGMEVCVGQSLVASSPTGGK